MTETAAVTTMDFKKFKRAVSKQLDHMRQAGGNLFQVNVEPDTLWATYLASFPPGSDPIHSKRSEHDCSSCKQFVRRVGGIVAIVNGQRQSIWDNLPEDGDGAVDAAYRTVAAVLSNLVRSAPICDVFLTTEATAGIDKNHGLPGIDGAEVKVYNHFYYRFPNEFLALPNKKNPTIGTRLSELRSRHGVLLRGLREISIEAVETVLDLIAQNSLYRGEENRSSVLGFGGLKTEFIKLANDGRAEEDFAWQRLTTVHGSVAGIRNTAIGTLLIDLSEGKEVDDAVRKFEAVVAPFNYKRPTALVTKAMIDKARATVTALGLAPALERRYATIDDVSVRDLLFVDRSPAAAVASDVFAEVAAGVKDKTLKKVEEVSVEKFLSDILPRAKTLEVMLESRHSGNLVSLIAPVDASAPRLFKWENGFSWSYNGDVADSIKERVKKAGGNITGELCCRLAWDYTDDLDFHMVEPTGYRIHFGVKRQKSRCGGILDLDANGGDGMRDDPAENIYYERIDDMWPGAYRLEVNNWNRRSRKPEEKGFEVEIDVLGEVVRCSYEKVLKTGETVLVAEIRKVGHDIVVEPGPAMSSTGTSRQLWGLTSQKFHPVSAVMPSPNYWAGAVGNRHLFFILRGCKADGSARGFYNEFLRQELEVHRKVLEVVGSKVRAEESDRQLSGLGFSSTQRNSVTVRVGGALTRVVKVVF